MPVPSSVRHRPPPAPAVPEPQAAAALLNVLVGADDQDEPTGARDIAAGAGAGPEAGKRRRRATQPPSQTTQRVLASLLKADHPVEIQELARLTQLTTYELGWRLVRMVQYDEISRDRQRDAKLGERYFYFLNGHQKAAAQAIIDPELRILPRDMPIGGPTKGLLKALLLAGDEVEVPRVAQMAGISESEAHWRLQCLWRLAVVARRRKNADAPWRYFLNKEQLPFAERATADDALELEGSLKSTRGKKRVLKQSLSEMNRTLQKDLDEIRRLETEISEKSDTQVGVSSEKEQLQRQQAKLIARAQGSPIALSQRHAFLTKLLSRPALEGEALLHEIAGDYLRALEIARGK